MRVKLLLCDSSCNIRHQQDLQHSDQNLFKTKDVEAFCDIAEYVLKRGGHGNAFCSVIQLLFGGGVFARARKRWRTVLKKRKSLR